MKSSATLPARPAATDYLELTKPRLTLFVLIVVALSAWLAGGPAAGWQAVFHAVLGTGLVAGGASALNMLFERRLDARMSRTRGRPLPSGRLHPPEVAFFGLLLVGGGLLHLYLLTTSLAALLAGLTAFFYLALYTPLKRITPLNTQIGAVPGALPALVGWAAVRGVVEPGAWGLFLIVYLWQLPHFLSIAWIYRKDYEQGGFRMLPLLDREGVVTGRQAALGALILVPASLLPAVAGVSGGVYFLGAVVLGAYLVRHAARFALRRTEERARHLMRASLVYLPLLLALMFLDRVA